MNTKITGLISAPFTPMKGDRSIATALIPDYYRFLKVNGVKGAFICGSTGEGASLSMIEKREMVDAWGDVTKEDPDFKVMMLTGGTSITEAIELAEYSRDAGLFGISFTAPYYIKPASVESLAESCKAIADRVPDLPFYYYHIPVLNGTNFPMINLLKIAKKSIPNFAGIKYTHEDFMDFLSCLRFEDGKYDMLWGRDENMLAALSLGTKGAVGSTYNYAAPLYSDMISAFEKNDLDEARRLQQRSIDMISLLGKYGGISTGKAFMRLLGFDFGEFRLPVKNMNDTEFKKFKADAISLGFYQYSSKNEISSKE